MLKLTFTGQEELQEQERKESVLRFTLRRTIISSSKLSKKQESHLRKLELHSLKRSLEHLEKELLKL